MGAAFANGRMPNFGSLIPRTPQNGNSQAARRLEVSRRVATAESNTRISFRSPICP
jgi:hypothetical protein